MPAELDQKCRALVEELGLGGAKDVSEVRPLAGGVSCDIAMVAMGDRRLCVKFALPKLKVAADWRAPVHRNAAEYAWLKVAAGVLPEGAVELFGRSEKLHGFAMEFIEGDDVYLWKASLLAEARGRGEAERVADALGRIHAASSGPGFETSPFQNRDDFRALRIEPYLSHTAKSHPGLAAPVRELEAILYDGGQVLVHGDVSPKNILFRSGGPVLLDAECATMGDASFDPSFCLNHLALKALHLPGSRDRLLADVDVFWRAYAKHVCWEPAEALEARVCRLLPVLMLARVDGKSPVEYLDETEREAVRRITEPLIRDPARTIDAFTGSLAAEMKGFKP